MGHTAHRIFSSRDIATFFATAWKVTTTLNRTGVRLIGPKPRWARQDGGEAVYTLPTFTTMPMPSAP